MVNLDEIMRSLSGSRNARVVALVIFMTDPLRHALGRG
jgi:hypothetical protein